MTYSFEATQDLRQEVRVDAAGTVVFYPKVDGVGNATASGTCTATIYKPDGALITGPTVIAPIAVSGVGSRFDVAVPAITDKQEDYYVVILWQTADAGPYETTTYFDVVREPWGPSTTSLNTLQSLAPDLADRIGRQAARLGQTAAQRASVIGHQARIELGDWIRAAVSADIGRMATVLSETHMTSRLGPYNYDQYLRPRLIKDTARLATIEAKLAVSMAYRADQRAGDEADDGSDTVAQLAGQWFAAAKASFNAMGLLRYDIDDDGRVDTLLTSVSRFIVQRRER